MEDPVRYKFLNIVQPVVVCMQRLSLHQWHAASGVVPCEYPMIDASSVHSWLGIIVADYSLITSSCPTNAHTVDQTC
jgi:hypothetical protein